MNSERMVMRRGLRRLSIFVWLVCLAVLGVHGGCGGGTSGTGVRSVELSGVVEGVDIGSGAQVTIVGEGGLEVAAATTGADGSYRVSVPEGTTIEAIVVEAAALPAPVVAPLATGAVAAEDDTTLTTTLVRAGETVVGETTAERAAPTPTRAGDDPTPVRGTPSPTPTVNPTAYCADRPNRPGCSTPRPTATPTINPTQYCADHPTRCGLPTATPTVNPTQYCAQFPNRPVCATPTP